MLTILQQPNVGISALRYLYAEGYQLSSLLLTPSKFQIFCSPPCMQTPCIRTSLNHVPPLIHAANLYHDIQYESCANINVEKINS